MRALFCLLVVTIASARNDNEDTWVESVAPVLTPGIKEDKIEVFHPQLPGGEDKIELLPPQLAGGDVDMTPFDQKDRHTSWLLRVKPNKSNP